MPTNLKDFLDVAEGLVKLVGLLAGGYVIVTGFAHRAGNQYGERIIQRRLKREGKPIFRPILREDKQLPFWKDEKLIHGGIVGARALLILLMYVILMLIAFPPDRQHLTDTVATLMGYPNCMAALHLVMLTIFLKRDYLGLLPLAFLSVCGAVGAWFIAKSIDVVGTRAVVWQTAIFITQSVLVSYSVGVLSGIRDSDLGKRLPVVEVLTIEGPLQGLRLLSSSDTEYRFLKSDGSEWLIPSAQIRMIKASTIESPDSGTE